MKDPDLWEKVTSISITDDMKEKLEKAIRMEIEDTVRYEAMLEECKERNELRNIAILRRVSHHEEEHGELIADLIEMSEDEFEELEEEIEFTGPFEMDEFIDHSIDKENEAIKLYTHIHMNTNDPSVSYIFRNLVNAEKKHKEILLTMK
jgi:rubrerythrin